MLAIRDIAPRAPTHILVMPREHIASAADLTEADAPLWSATSSPWPPRSPGRQGIAEGGYRVVTNVGTWGGQTVDHLHFHLMGGRPFEWPPDEAARAAWSPASRLARACCSPAVPGRTAATFPPLGSTPGSRRRRDRATPSR